MPTIRVLPPEVANQIAAGEVVERPASVIRELLDNAVDAGATRISVEVEDGGLKNLRVTDNGCGMSPEDALLCTRRHATSKILRSEDLENITTKGFRGEALASIASVSRFKLITRRDEDTEAVMVQIDGGTTVNSGPAAGPPGTTILVSDLFYNLPARKKFLKRPTTEMEHVCSTVTWLALAHERVHFTLVHNGRSVMELPAVASRAERIMNIYGRGIMGDLLPVSMDTPALSVSGFISRPTLTRNGAQHIFTFVNDRYIRNRTVQRALMDGYRNILPTGRYPLVFLYLELDPRTIDINVHPTKQEVKFARENEVFTAVYGAVRQAWEQPAEEKHPAEPAPQYHFPPRQPPQTPIPRSAVEITNFSPKIGGDTERVESVVPVTKPVEWGDTASKSSPPRIGGDTEGVESVVPVTKPVEWGDAVLKPSPPKIGGDTEGVESIGPTAKPVERADAVSKISPPKFGGDTEGVESSIPPDLLRASSVDEAPELRVLGQLANSYILAESNGALFIIDQHAAHERILFERFLTHSARGPLASQILLFPATIDLSPAEMQVLSDSTPVFHRLGFELEPFGLSTYAIRAIPGDLNLEAASELVKDMVTALQGEGNTEEKVERALHTLACRAAVKFGDPLDRDSMEAIADGLRSIPRRDFCPHGRPSVVCLSPEALRKSFRRT